MPADKTEQGQGAQSPSDAEVFELLTATNNELAVMHRELGRKTLALERVLAQRNEFLGVAAHDLRNPLQVIGGMSKMLMLSPNLSDKERKLLRSISESSAFMRRLVDDLLQITEFEAGPIQLQRETMSLAGLVRERVEFQQMIALEKQIVLQARVPDGLPDIFGDRMRLTQVIDNLLTNAIKYSDPGSTVSAHLHGAPESVRLSVRDHGRGIAPDELNRLFKPFSVTSTRGTAGEKSTGLGLLIVKRIAEAHGGRVLVRSRPGVGSTFHVILPVGRDDAAAGSN